MHTHSDRWRYPDHLSGWCRPTTVSSASCNSPGCTRARPRTRWTVSYVTRVELPCGKCVIIILIGSQQAFCEVWNNRRTGDSLGRRRSSADRKTVVEPSQSNRSAVDRAVAADVHGRAARVGRVHAALACPGTPRYRKTDADRAPAESSGAPVRGHFVAVQPLTGRTSSRLPAAAERVSSSTDGLDPSKRRQRRSSGRHM